jgi:hypothetical protein
MERCVACEERMDEGDKVRAILRQHLGLGQRIQFRTTTGDTMTDLPKLNCTGCWHVQADLSQLTKLPKLNYPS